MYKFSDLWAFLVDFYWIISHFNNLIQRESSYDLSCKWTLESMVHSIVRDFTMEKSDGNLPSIYENTQGAIYKNIHEYGPYIKNIFGRYLHVSTATGCATHSQPTGMANPFGGISLDSIERFFQCRMPYVRDETTRLCLKTMRDALSISTDDGHPFILPCP